MMMLLTLLLAFAILAPVLAFLAGARYEQMIIRRILDHGIRDWRGVRAEDIEKIVISEEEYAVFYIDAYQKVRKSVCGEFLEVEDDNQV